MWWVGRITGCDPPAIHRHRCSNGPDERTLQGYGRPIDREPPRPARRPPVFPDPTPTDRRGDRPRAWECSPLIRSSCCSSSSRSARRSAECAIKGVGLGPAAALFAGLGVSAINPDLAELPAIIPLFGLALFIYTSDSASGPAFFGGLRQDGLRVSVAVARAARRDRADRRRRQRSCSTSTPVPVPGCSPDRRRTRRHCRPRSSSSLRRSRRTRSPTRSSATRSCIPLGVVAMIAAAGWSLAPGPTPGSRPADRSRVRRPRSTQRDQRDRDRHPPRPAEPRRVAIVGGRTARLLAGRFRTTGYSTSQFRHRNTSITFSTALCIGARKVSPPQTGQFGTGLGSKSLGKISDIANLLLLARRQRSPALDGDWFGTNVREQRRRSECVAVKNSQKSA